MPSFKTITPEPIKQNIMIILDNLSPTLTAILGCTSKIGGKKITYLIPSLRIKKIYEAKDHTIG